MFAAVGGGGSADTLVPLRVRVELGRTWKTTRHTFHSEALRFTWTSISTPSTLSARSNRQHLVAGSFWAWRSIRPGKFRAAIQGSLNLLWRRVLGRYEADCARFTGPCLSR